MKLCSLKILLALATAASTTPPVWAQVVPAGKNLQQLNSWGLPSPNGSSRSFGSDLPAMRPDLPMDPGLLPVNPDIPRYGTGLSRQPQLNPRLLLNPVVASNSLGFFNSASQNLSFDLETGGTTKTITLSPNEILTITVQQGDKIEAKISVRSNTGVKSAATPLSAGGIYVLRAAVGQWEFIRL